MLQIKGWLLLALGIGLVAVALQGAWRGWLPTGRNGYKPGTGVFRDRQPVGFLFFFLLYLGGGLYVAFYALHFL